MTDRGAELAALVRQHESLQAEAKRAAKVAKEELDELADRISALAAEIESGQATLFEEPAAEPGSVVCPGCGDDVGATVSVRLPGQDPTEPVAFCYKCLKRTLKKASA